MVLTLFEQALVAKNRARSTRQMYVATARRFLREIGPKPLDAVTSDDIQRFLGRGHAQQSQRWRRELQALRAFFRVLVEQRLTTSDPSQRLTLPTPRDIHWRAIPLDVIEAVLAAASERTASHALSDARALRDRALMELLFATGLRNSEAGAVLVADLNLKLGDLSVRPVKNGRQRSLPIPPTALAHLRLYLLEGRPLLAKLRRDRSHFLLSLKGRPLSRGVLHQLVAEIAARAKVHAYPHAVRRALATAFLREGAPLPVVQHLLGHRSLAVTDRYLCVEHGETRAALQRLAHFVERP